MPKYCVSVYFSGMDNFIVEADDPEQAKEKAEEAFRDGQPPDVCGNEWQQIDDCGEPEEVR